MSEATNQVKMTWYSDLSRDESKLVVSETGLIVARIKKDIISGEWSVSVFMQDDPSHLDMYSAVWTPKSSGRMVMKYIGHYLSQEQAKQAAKLRYLSEIEKAERTSDHQDKGGNSIA
jgi:hypothetical protein